MGSNVTLLSSVLPESIVRGCLDATHSVSRETVFGRRQQRRTALSVTCISWVRPSTSIRPLSKQKRFTWNQATPMKRFRQRCTQVWILPVSVSRLSCHRKLKTTPLLHSARGAVTRPTGVEQAFLSIKGLTGSPLQHTIHQPVVQRLPRVSRSSATAGSSSRDSSTATQRCQRLHEAGSAVLRGEVRTTTARRFLHRRASPQQCQSSLHGARGFTWNNARSSQARSSHTPLRSNAVTQTVPFHVKHGSFTLSGREVGAETVSVSAPKASFSHSTSATPRRATSPAPAPRRCGRGRRPRRIRS